MGHGRHSSWPFGEDSFITKQVSCLVHGFHPVSFTSGSVGILRKECRREQLLYEAYLSFPY